VRIGLIYNPTAGPGDTATLAGRAAALLENAGHPVQSRASGGCGQATAQAAALLSQVDAVVAVGGDGTINEVANALAGSEVPLGIVPAGTINVLAQELGLPFAVEEACRVIAAGRQRRLDLGWVAGRHFVLMCGAGLDALTIRRVDPQAKRRFREAAFLWAGVRAFLHEPPPAFVVRTEGELFRATFVVVANCRYYGGRFGIATRADPGDGLLDVVSFAGRGFARNALFWLSTPLGLHLRHPGVTYRRARRVELIPEHPQDVVWLQTDGEAAGRLPAVAEIRPGALRVLVP